MGGLGPGVIKIRLLYKIGLALGLGQCEDQWRSQPDIWSCKCKFFFVYRPYKESFSKEMNNNNDLNLRLHDQMSGWLRCWGGLGSRVINIPLLYKIVKNKHNKTPT